MGLFKTKPAPIDWVESGLSIGTGFVKNESMLTKLWTRQVGASKWDLESVSFYGQPLGGKSHFICFYSQYGLNIFCTPVLGGQNTPQEKLNSGITNAEQ